MPQCAVGDKCICPDAPLQGRHFCAICKKQLHGPCGEFNGDEGNITYCNRCFNCCSDPVGATVTADISAPSTNKQSATQQSAIVAAKDIEPKAVTWLGLISLRVIGHQRNRERQVKW